jgi:hypothetical protein
MQRFFGEFENEESVIGAFEIPDHELEDAEIIVALYSCEDYSGSALVLFRRGGQLFEVHGSHCSCNGLEGQWEPEPTSEADLWRELKNGAWDDFEGAMIPAVFAAIWGINADGAHSFS